MIHAKSGALVRRGTDGSEASIVLQQDITTLGRSQVCSVVIPAPTISRLHARVERQHDRYMLFDAGSANGTFLNRQRIARGQRLAPGDEIWLGSSAVSFCFAGPEEPPAMTSGDVCAPLYIDELARSICVYGVPVALGPQEYGLLLYLAGNPGTVCTRESCMLAVWGRSLDRVGDALLDDCIAGLRYRLRAAAQLAAHD